MTAKEKALNLCQEFGMTGMESKQTEYYTLELPLAKKCAIICVDEMLAMLPFPNDEWHEERKSYLLEVKEEIEKLKE